MLAMSATNADMRADHGVPAVLEMAVVAAPVAASKPLRPDMLLAERNRPSPVADQTEPMALASPPNLTTMLAGTLRGCRGAGGGARLFESCSTAQRAPPFSFSVAA